MIAYNILDATKTCSQIYRYVLSLHESRQTWLRVLANGSSGIHILDNSHCQIYGFQMESVIHCILPETEMICMPGRVEETQSMEGTIHCGVFPAFIIDYTKLINCGIDDKHETIQSSSIVGLGMDVVNLKLYA